MAAVESAFAIKNDLKGTQAPKFSEQQVIDCSIGKNNGCNGGFILYALDYIMNNGLEQSITYPYRANVSL